MISSYMIFYLTLGFIGLIAPKMYTTAVNAGDASVQSSNSNENRGWQRGSILAKELIGIALLILLILCLFKFVIRPLEADSYTIRAFQAQDSKSRLALYKKTLSLSSVGKYQIIEQFTDYTMNAAQSALGTTLSIEDYKAELDFLKGQLEENIKESPLNLRAYLKLGEVCNSYARIGQNELTEAEIVLKQAQDLSPNNQQSYWTLAQTKLYEGDAEAAFTLAEKARALEPNRVQSNLISMQVAKIIGKNDVAEQIGQDLLKIDPSMEARVKQILGTQ
jgi:tetratricopeptide (TPR) repeat protein